MYTSSHPPIMPWGAIYTYPHGWLWWNDVFDMYNGGYWGKKMKIQPWIKAERPHLVLYMYRNDHLSHYCMYVCMYTCPPTMSSCITGASIYNTSQQRRERRQGEKLQYIHQHHHISHLPTRLSTYLLSASLAFCLHVYIIIIISSRWIVQV